MLEIKSEGKSIKKYLKIIIRVLAITLFMPALLYVLILIPAVQTLVVQYFTNQLSTSLNTEISIRRIHFVPFKRVIVNDFLIRDQQSDTLLFMSKFHASVDSFSIKNKRVYLKKVRLDKPQVKIYKIDSLDFNYSFLARQFLNVDSVPDTVAWNVFPAAVTFVNGHGEVGLYEPNVIDFKIDNLSINLENINYQPDSISFALASMSMSGFKGVNVNDAKGEIGISYSRFTARDLWLNGDNSSALIDSLSVGFAGESGPLLTFNESDFFADITLLKVNPLDLAKLSRNKLHFFKDFTFSGRLQGTGSNIKGRNILLGYGSSTSLLASVDIKGLPDFKNSFLFLDIKELITNSSDIAQLASAGVNEPLVIPRFVEEMGEISYSGNITGFLNDLVAYGRWKSKHGTIRTDLGVKWKDDEKLYFAGAVNTSNFRVGNLLNSREMIGDMSMSVLIRGSYFNSSEYFTYIDGNINSLSINGYNYNNIQLGGLINPYRFDGKVDMTDENGDFSFLGKIDYNKPLPEFAFEAEGAHLDVEKLGIYPSMKEGKLSFGLSAQFIGESIDDVVGNIDLSHFKLANIDKSLKLDSLNLHIERVDSLKIITLNSEILEGELKGVYNFSNIKDEFNRMIGIYTPSVATKVYRNKKINDNIFDFKVSYHKADEVIRFFYPNVSITDSGEMWGNYNSSSNEFEVSVELGDGAYKDISVVDLSLSARGNSNQKAYVSLRTKELMLPAVGKLYNFTLQQYVHSDTVSTNLFWNNWGEKTNSGAIYSQTNFERHKDGLHTFYQFMPSEVMIDDSVWHLNASSVYINPTDIVVKGFEFARGNKGVSINGIISDSEDKLLSLNINNIDLEPFLNSENSTSYSLEGLLNADVDVFRAKKDPIVNSDIYISNLVVNNDTLGFLSLNSEWEPQSKSLNMSIDAVKDGSKILDGGGDYLYDSGLMNLDFTAQNLPAGFLNFYLSNILQNIKGTTSGKIALQGPISGPQLSARLKLNPTTFDVDLLKTSYVLSDSVILVPDRMIFKDMKVVDKYGNIGIFSGSIGHNLFSNMRYDLKIDCKKVLALDTREKDNPDYYGTVFADGRVTITGETSDISIDVGVKTMPGTNFFVPLGDDGEVAQNDFIRFVTSGDIDGDKHTSTPYHTEPSALDLNFDIEVTPDAKIQVLFDGKNGDILKGAGRGDINVRIDKLGKISFFGEYVLEDGNYLFSFQNIVNKRFLINSGSSVRWEGDPYDAIINLDATYKLKASLYDLVSGIAGNDVVTGDMKRRVPINLNLHLNDRVMRPNIRFDIETPSTQDINQSIIDQYITSEEELNRQVLSLLILNRFYTPDNAQVSQESQSRSGNSAALVTTTEVLSSQLSSWLSQISNDFDVGVAYRPGDEITNEEIEVALSTQIFNNRVILNGNLGYGRNQTAASNIIGDFDMEVKLNNKGTVRAKAYTHSNNDLIYETSPTTQGVGLSFREEFNTFGELLRKYWSVITGEKRRQRKNAVPETTEEFEDE